jgi:excisionase family DNA binding protein
MPVAGLLTTAEVADRLGIDRSAVTRAVQLGRLTIADRMEGRTGPMLFDPAEVDRYATTRTEAQ